MSTVLADSSVSSAAGGWLRRNRHFMLAAGFLGFSALAWFFLPGLLNMYLIREPVPWPAAVAVGEDFRLLNEFDLGPYVKVTQDGLFAKPDGQPDGEVVFSAYDLEVLGISVGYARSRRDSRTGNWYVSRIYRDTRVAAGAPFEYWQLNITYYTGGIDTVPHIPDVCLAASGATVVDTEVVPLSAASPSESWSGQIRFCRTAYEQSTDSGVWRGVQYYVFSLNGLPTHDWKAVRLKLASPLTRHAYFAKLQFAPRNAVESTGQADQRAEEFLRHALPEVLKFLPSRADVERLRRSD